MQVGTYINYLMENKDLQNLANYTIHTGGVWFLIQAGHNYKPVQ